MTTMTDLTETEQREGIAYFLAVTAEAVWNRPVAIAPAAVEHALRGWRASVLSADAACPMDSTEFFVRLEGNLASAARRLPAGVGAIRLDLSGGADHGPFDLTALVFAAGTMVAPAPTALAA